MRKNHATIASAIEIVMRQLEEKGYSVSSKRNYRQIYREFAEYARRRRYKCVTPSLTDSFCTYKEDLSFRSASSRRNVVAMMRRLLESTSGDFLPRKLERQRIYTPSLERELALIDAWADQKLGWSPSTRAQRLNWMRRFIESLPRRKQTPRWDKLQIAEVFDFLHTLPDDAVVARFQAAKGLAALFRVLCAMGHMSTSLHEAIHISCRIPECPPAVWAETDALRLLECVDRSTPPGRRDYAILSLAYHLGIRAVDIRVLRLDALRWEREIIEFTQRKTMRRIRLPLLPELGDAIIDYLRHERPKSRASEIFLRHTAPIEPFREGYKFYDLLRRYARKAGIPNERRTGLHGFRRAVGIRLMEAKHPLPVIAACLGHSELNSTRKYLSVSMDLLRDVAVDPEKEIARG